MWQVELSLREKRPRLQTKEHLVIFLVLFINGAGPCLPPRGREEEGSTVVVGVVVGFTGGTLEDGFFCFS